MHDRRRLRLTGVVGVLAAAAIAVSLIQLSRYHHQQRTAATVPAPLAIGTELRKPRKVPAVRLADEQGRPTSLATWRGKWIVLAPSMTLCHEVCPMTTAALTELQSRLGPAGLSRQVEVVEATVDPRRDTPARLRAYRRLTGASFTMLTGSQGDIARLWRFFGVYYKRVPQGHPADVDWLTHNPETFDVEHTDAFFLIDPAGQERVLDEGMPSVGGRLPAKLRILLNDQGVHNLQSPQLPWTAANVLEDLYFLMNRNVPASSIPPVTTPTRSAAAKALSGSPHALATLHQQAGRLLASGTSLTNALDTLHGYPVVINAWASWCAPCRQEFSLFASASARYGKRVAFLGSDTSDSSSDATAFLTKHPVSYPSYQGTMQSLSSLAQLEGLPTTIFLDGKGRVVFVHTGSYQAQTSLDQDIERYALSGK
jgi:cytochrome oxidase Cu insertion factor (SCO1/SenC/PrrC family)/thiol-disulfide isomerase/thioredoxin